MQRHYGLYRGTVVNNKDPIGQRRLKILVPAVLADGATNWVWPVDPSGLTLRPPTIGQGVWVMFENGDPSFPVWLGVFGRSTGSQVEITALANRVADLEARVSALEAL